MKFDITDTGLFELHISDNPDDFVHLSKTIRNKLKGKWVKKIDGLDQSYWDLTVDGLMLTVHREHYLGVTVFCKNDFKTLMLLHKLKEILEKELEIKTSAQQGTGADRP